MFSPTSYIRVYLHYKELSTESTSSPELPLPNKAPYRINPEETKEIQRQVKDLIDHGHVCESLSPCAAPVILVPKHDGTFRMCSDCRPINAITVRYRYPIPRLDDMLDELSGATIFSKIDLKSGYDVGWDPRWPIFHERSGSL